MTTTVGMVTRLRAAWNVLRGRPTVAFVPRLVLSEPLHVDRTFVVVGNTLGGPR